MDISLRPVRSAITANTSLDVLFSLRASEGEVPPRRPLNLSLVIDRSGSMGGTPLSHAIKAGQNLVKHLKAEDWISVVIFDDNVETVVAACPGVDHAAIQKAIGDIRAGGCTNLHGGWKQGTENVAKKKLKGQINRVLLLTDGQANVGESRSEVLIGDAAGVGKKGTSTTTLGFGSYFQEDLLIGMARNSGGNFYFIQSVDEATDVFDIEMQSLLSMAAANLRVQLVPVAGVQADFVTPGPVEGGAIVLGDVYGSEPRNLAFHLDTTGLAEGTQTLATLKWSYDVSVNGEMQTVTGESPLTVTISASAGALDVETARTVANIRMARVKDEAVDLADKGNYAEAGSRLRAVVASARADGLDNNFEFAEEIDQLEHYAQSLEGQKFGTSIRKELRDQAHQGANRSRGDLKLRGTSGDSSALKTLQQADVSGGVLLSCVRESGKLRIKVLSDGFDADKNVQFPRALREENVTYLAEGLALSADGGFYRATGEIKRVLKPGEVVRGASTPRAAPKRKALANPPTAASLPTTDVVDGVLVQCVKEGSKLRARVVSDGYNPDWNMRFPRSIRELGVLYVVEEVEPVAGGGSYIAYGSIKRLVQP